MSLKNETGTLEEMLDLSPQFGRVVDLSQRNKGVETRRKKLAEPVFHVEDEENPGQKIVIGKKCAMHMLAVFRVLDPKDLADFVDTIMWKKPQNVVVSDAVVCGVHPANVKRVMRELGYKEGNALWDQSIHHIVDMCMEVTTDNCLIFNEARIMSHLDPIERNTVSAMADYLKGSTVRPILGFVP